MYQWYLQEHAILNINFITFVETKHLLTQNPKKAYGIF